MQHELLDFLVWLLRRAVICILVWVLGAVTSKSFCSSFPGLQQFSHMQVLMSYSTYSRVSLCRSLHFSLSPQLSTQCWCPLWALATLASLDSQLHFLNLGSPQALPGFLLPGPRPGNSQGSKLGKCVACVVCFLSSRDHCLLLLVVQNLKYCCFIHFVRFLLFMQKAKSGLFYSILTGNGTIVVLFCIFIMTSDIWHILICLLTIHMFSLVKSLFKALAFFLLSLLMFFFILCLLFGCVYVAEGPYMSWIPVLC